MKAKRTKGRCRPPWWCRAALYAAVVPRPELYDYSRKLPQEYLRRARDPNEASGGQQYALREAIMGLGCRGESISRRDFFANRRFVILLFDGGAWTR